MKRTLDDLCAMAGINGVFVCTDEGNLIEFSAPRIYDAETLTLAATAAARAAESISVQHSEWETLVAHFNDGKLMYNRMEQYLLCVILDQGTNLPFLNVAIKVAKNKIKRKLEGGASSMAGSRFAEGRFSSQFVSEPQKMEGAGQPVANSGFPQGMYSSTVQHAPASARSMGGSSFGEAGSGMLWSGMGASSMQSSAVSVANEASSKLLTRMSEALAEIVGPMAKVFVKEAVQKVCPQEPFSMIHAKRLQQEIEQVHISDDDELVQFRKNI